MGKAAYVAVGTPLVLVTVLAAAGCNGAPVNAAQNHQNRDAQVEGIVVEVLSPARTQLARTTTQPATVHAWYEARVFAKVSGYLVDLKVDIGQAVQAGDVLAIIDVPEVARQRESKVAVIRRMEADEQRAAADLAVAHANVAAQQAKLEKAQSDVGKLDAALRAAQIEMDRVSDLAGQRAVADSLLDEAKARYEISQAERATAIVAIKSAEADRDLASAQALAAKASVNVAQAMTDVARRELEELDILTQYSRLTAPFDGVVTERHVELGDLVRNTQNASGQSGDPLFVIHQLQKVRLRVAVPERDAPLVSVGDSIDARFQALPGSVFDGKVARFAGVMDEKTRTMLVEMDLPNADRKLLPGMFGQATIVLESSQDRLVLPSNAVRYDEAGNSYVYVVDEESRARIVPVQTGSDSGKQIEINSGLDGSERVVGPLLRRPVEGQKVRIN